MSFASCWNGQVLRVHETREAAQADVDDCNKRRRADVERCLPIGARVHERVVDKTVQDEHVGVFEVRELTSA